MARSVFFSFHYQRDIMRAQVVKQHHITKDNYTTAGFFDGSLEEKSKKDGNDVVKRMINKGLVGSSVTCVLIGNETNKRRWVDYEILKSVELGMGVLGIRIHQIADARKVTFLTDGKDLSGSSPFAYLGYNRKGSQLTPMINYNTGWEAAPMMSAISDSAAPYLKGTGSLVLSSIFSVYDWIDDGGYANFAKWVERAAKQAGR
jgi:hypothetical protein